MPSTPNTQTVIVFGPNLSNTNETFHVHAKGCSDCAKYIRQGHAPDEFEAASLLDIVEDVYCDILAEDEVSTVDDYASDFRVFPCVKDLPYNEMKTPVDEEEDGPDTSFFTDNLDDDDAQRIALECLRDHQEEAPEADTFTLTMDLSNEAMKEAWDVASALRVVSGRVEAGATSGPVKDTNGNTIGTFSLTRPAPAKVEDADLIDEIMSQSYEFAMSVLGHAPDMDDEDDVSTEPIYYEVERETVFGVLEVLIFRPIPAYQLTDDYILNL